MPKSSRFLPWSIVGVFALSVVLVWSVIFFGDAHANSEALYFLNVGQGDSSLVVLPGGAKILIDGGPSSALLENLAMILSPTDHYIDMVVMTHPQLDHFGGLVDLIKNYDVGAFVGSGRSASIAAYTALHEALEDKKIPYVQVQEGDGITIGSATLSVLSPSPNELISAELNDSSVVLLLDTGTYKALYTGDIGAPTEERLTHTYDMNIDILKVAHHGSKYSSGDAFLAEATPAVSVIEVGKNNYGHPTKEALGRLQKYSTEVLRTDERGIVKVVFKDGKLEVFGNR